MHFVHVSWICALFAATETSADSRHIVTNGRTGEASLIVLSGGEVLEANRTDRSLEVPIEVVGKECMFSFSIPETHLASFAETFEIEATLTIKNLDKPNAFVVSGGGIHFGVVGKGGGPDYKAPWGMPIMYINGPNPKVGPMGRGIDKCGNGDSRDGHGWIGVRNKARPHVEYKVWVKKLKDGLQMHFNGHTAKCGLAPGAAPGQWFANVNSKTKLVIGSELVCVKNAVLKTAGKTILALPVTTTTTTTTTTTMAPALVRSGCSLPRPLFAIAMASWLLWVFL